jgi:hypothetical protein
MKVTTLAIVPYQKLVDAVMEIKSVAIATGKRQLAIN